MGSTDLALSSCCRIGLHLTSAALNLRAHSAQTPRAEDRATRRIRCWQVHAVAAHARGEALQRELRRGREAVAEESGASATLGKRRSERGAAHPRGRPRGSDTHPGCSPHRERACRPSRRRGRAWRAACGDADGSLWREAEPAGADDARAPTRALVADAPEEPPQPQRRTARRRQWSRNGYRDRQLAGGGSRSWVRPVSVTRAERSSRLGVAVF